MKNKILILLFIASLIFVAVPAALLAAVSPQIFHFSVIQDGPSQTIKDTLNSQLYVEVWDDTTEIRFSFHNYNYIDPGATSHMVVTNIYFADTTDQDPGDLPGEFLLDYYTPTINNVSGVEYQVASHLNFPEGNDIGFEAIQGFDPNPPATPPGGKGIHPGDELDISFNYLDSHNYDNLIDALNDGSVDIGMHVQAIGIYNRSSLAVHLTGGGPVSGPVHTPEPTTMLLLGTGLAGIVGAARRRKKLQ